jgi:hypothetical protein
MIDVGHEPIDFYHENIWDSGTLGKLRCNIFSNYTILLRNSSAFTGTQQS